MGRVKKKERGLKKAGRSLKEEQIDECDEGIKTVSCYESRVEGVVSWRQVTVSGNPWLEELRRSFLIAYVCL